MTQRAKTWRLCTGWALAGLVWAAAAVHGQTTPPDLTVCQDVDCDNVQNSVCSDAGFQISLTGFTPPATSTGGFATYTYQVCSPALGVCDGTLRAGETCADNDFCRRKGQSEDPLATCSRECAVDSFRGLSHFDIAFPELGASCLSQSTSVSGSCRCSTNASGGCSVGAFGLGDASCFGSAAAVAKCDSTNLGAGDCITMTLTIAGELTGLGSGPAIVVDKESTTCTASCMSGPSCSPCGGEEGEACLTRTIGFWGTHPWITNDFAPVTACGQALGCTGAATANAGPGCPAGSCGSVIEGLCSIPGELSTNQAYVAMVRQLTAAKLNLNATASLFPGATCSSFTYMGRSVQEWIAECEALCGADKATLSGSGCTEALDAFNNSQDVGFEVTPSPFDRPSVDDFGRISGADPSQCGKAKGNGKDPKLVIGKKVGGNDCR